MKYKDRLGGRPLRLKIARLLSGLEQGDVARALYDGRGATISDWETGKTKNIPNKMLDRACRLYYEHGGISGLWIREAVPPILDVDVQFLEDGALGEE